MGGVPLYNNNNHSPGNHMDLNILLSAVNWPEQLRQDGFEMSEVWQGGPMVGTNQFAPPHQQHGYAQPMGMGYVGGWQ